MKFQKIYYILIPILCALLAAVSYYKIINNNKESDAIKFKNEYEELNNKKANSSNQYKNIKIDKENPVKYSNYDEIIDVINNKTGVIYLGFPECPWCRTALPVLLDVLSDNDVGTLYYLNIKSERDSYVVQDGEITYELDNDNNPIKGSEGYFKLLDALDEYLTDYTLEVDGKIYEVGEKRLYAPSVIFVRNGEVLGIQVSTVESQKSGYDELTDEEYEELYSIYEDYILDMYSSTCSTDSSC